MKNIILIFSMLVLFLFARIIVHFSAAPTHELFAAYVSDDHIFPSEWYFSYIGILTVEELTERRENDKVNLLQSVLVQRYEDLSDGNIRTIRLLEKIISKGVSINSITGSKCIYLDYLSKGAELDILAYLVAHINGEKVKRECHDVILRAKNKYKVILSLQEQEKLDYLAGQLEN